MDFAVDLKLPYKIKSIQEKRKIIVLRMSFSIKCLRNYFHGIQ